MNEILKYDPDFSESKFKTYVDNVFIQLHLAVVTKEIDNVKHFLSEEVYNTYKQKIENLTKNHQIQMYDEINVAQTEILNYEITNTEMIIKVYILSRYLDYLMDEDANYISGDTDVRSERANYLTFIKKKTIKNQLQLENVQDVVPLLMLMLMANVPTAEQYTTSKIKTGY